MALPMVHLLAAYRWAQDRPAYAACPEFYLGTVSPDAIHIRDGNDKSRKNEFHLNNWRTPDADAVEEYWKTHFTPFDVGYGIHVLLDGHWAVGFRRDFPQMLFPSGKPDPEIYYNDTFTSDYRTYHESPLTPFFIEMLSTAKAPADHPLLTAQEIDAWRQWTLDFYINKKPSGNPVRFITPEYINAFLEKIPDVFSEVYERMERT